jgi:hypothetical protein
MQANDQGFGAGGEPQFGQSLGQPAWAALVPAAIVAGSGEEQPVERLLTVQSAIAKGVHLAVSLGQIRLRLPRHLSLRLRVR